MVLRAHDQEAARVCWNAPRTATFKSSPPTSKRGLRRTRARTPNLAQDHTTWNESPTRLFWHKPADQVLPRVHRLIAGRTELRRADRFACRRGQRRSSTAPRTGTTDELWIASEQ